MLALRQAIDLDGSLIPPPPGVESNFANPPNRNDLGKAVDLTSLVLATVFFILRVYTRFKLRSRINIVDVLSTLAFILWVPYVYINYRLTYSGGYFVHTWDIRVRDLPDFQYVIFVASVLYIPILSIVKMAILFEWAHIFVPRGTRNSFWWACHIAIAFVAAWGILALILLNVNCTPFEANWNLLIPGGYCRFSFPALTLSSAIINFVLDLVPLILPQKIIWSLNMSWSKKIGVSLVFAVGLLGVIAALIRVVLTAQYVSTTDTIYFVSQVGLLALTEITTGFLVLCTPSIPKAFDSIVSKPRLLSLRAWYSRYKDSKLNSGSSLSHDTDISAAKAGRYQQVDERSLIPLTDVRQSKTEISQYGRGITREVRFTATTEVAGQADAGHEQYRSQHPWARDVV
ncbi:hypothetical protein EKO27_g10599 [Xylaria grammica]|uniref:Rhodopsin domain-containing protein n=1 Tax=Xylaria grammica TaxID=363999 RepID=A0A439CQX7_9PEZI|nr:hypothetical protein EKO27_g10599 [Xylaria grammica]